MGEGQEAAVWRDRKPVHAQLSKVSTALSLSLSCVSCTRSWELLRCACVHMHGITWAGCTCLPLSGVGFRVLPLLEGACPAGAVSMPHAVRAGRGKGGSMWAQRWCMYGVGWCGCGVLGGPGLPCLPRRWLVVAATQATEARPYGLEEHGSLHCTALAAGS